MNVKRVNESVIYAVIIIKRLFLVVVWTCNRGSGGKGE